MPPLLRAGILPAVLAIAFLVFATLENAMELRRRVEGRLRRNGRNLFTAALGFAVVELLRIPVLLPVSRATIAHQWGILGWIGARGWLRTAAAIVLLDYTLWFWHWMNHRVTFFWRFHAVHHVDRDLDASTGLRFHFGELGFSVGYRALQVAAIGADPFSIALWQAVLSISVMFHHSNTRLPLAFERILVRLIVTPRMHGIHHSDIRRETDSNWSSLLSAWDYLHRTIRLDVPQQAITIGVPAYRDAGSVTVGKILAMPFRRRRDDWALGGSRELDRHPSSPSRATLRE